MHGICKKYRPSVKINFLFWLKYQENLWSRPRGVIREAARYTNTRHCNPVQRGEMLLRLSCQSCLHFLTVCCLKYQQLPSPQNTLNLMDCLSSTYMWLPSLCERKLFLLSIPGHLNIKPLTIYSSSKLFFSG